MLNFAITVLKMADINLASMNMFFRYMLPELSKILAPTRFSAFFLPHIAWQILSFFFLVSAK
jgi:hypothetical protein